MLNNRLDLANKRISEPEYGSNKITQNEAKRSEERLSDTRNRMLMPITDLNKFPDGNNTEDRVAVVWSHNGLELTWNDDIK